MGTGTDLNDNSPAGADCRGIFLSPDTEEVHASSLQIQERILKNSSPPEWDMIKYNTVFCLKQHCRIYAGRIHFRKRSRKE
jgi:hypothetical protein